ncbi:hypothetical protein SLS56_007798 [Neofusicoccum ribis]|uniref:Uncharacterized protein n=1 Tax=Neofusicoccum ribis TaxID=45134 RepID=A0ABR3SLX8_9PEZI
MPKTPNLHNYTMGKQTITIREALRRLALPDEHALHTAILTQPFFLPTWAEFRDDLLWGKPDATGLSGHIFLKCVVPAAVRELLNPDGPSEYYIPRDRARPDKTPYIPSDHYVRLILLTLPPLREPGRLLHARVRDEHDLATAVDALGYLVHVLRNQYRPGNAGQLSRTLQRLAPPSRHAERARLFDNPRCAAHSGRAATDAPAATTAFGTDAAGLAARRVASADPAAFALAAQRAAAAPAPPSGPRLDRHHQHQQRDRRQHQHHQHGPAAPGLPCPSTAPAPAPASAPASQPVMAVSARRFKRSRSEEEGETGLHDVPAKASRIGLEEEV